MAPASRGRPAKETPPAKENRSEEHTSELQSQSKLVCRLLLQKKLIRAGSTGQTRVADSAGGLPRTPEHILFPPRLQQIRRLPLEHSPRLLLELDRQHAISARS